MSHTYVSLLTHVIFSTKDRVPHIDGALEERLFPYFGAIIRDLKGTLIAVNGAGNHVHLLLSLATIHSLADVVKNIKGPSTLWIHETFPDRRHFAWQRGYAAFSVSKSNEERVAAYIARQKSHHQRADFRDELLEILRRHGVTPDERYLWT